MLNIMNSIQKPQKTVKLVDVKDILTIQIYLIIKYISIDNKYIEGAFTMLDLQNYINGIDAFLKS